MNPDSLLLAIPVFNEERHVEDVIREARRYCRRVLVIDDGSTDATPRILDRLGGLFRIRHAENRGYGKSLADAFAFALREGYDWLITMDCDRQHEPARIPRFCEAIEADDADIISGTRYPAGFDADTDAPPDRRRINREITALLNRRLGLRLTDAFCGFKAYRVDALRCLRLTVPGYAMPMQFWVQAARAGLRIREIPVRLLYPDPTRHFGGFLDDPAARRRHYLEVFEAELAAGGVPARARTNEAPCR
ncbi:MAG: glycosyltransferase family 2 protein [Planctomycetota bacterium]|nr:MAG: glycosyltransferase family 2 protein [Planctomycetota bacterium]